MILGLLRWLLWPLAVVIGVLVAYLPERVKQSPTFAGVASSGAHVISAAIEIGVAGVILAELYAKHVPATAAALAQAVGDAGKGDLGHGLAAGNTAFLSFLAHPLVWIALFHAVEGLVRVVEVTVLDQRPGCALLVLALAPFSPGRERAIPPLTFAPDPTKPSGPVNPPVRRPAPTARAEPLDLGDLDVPPAAPARASPPVSIELPSDPGDMIVLGHEHDPPR